MYSKTGEIAWRNHIHRSDTLLALFRRVLLKGTGRSPFAVGGLSAVADEPVAQQRSGEDWLQFDTGTIGYTSTDTGPTAEPNAEGNRRRDAMPPKQPRSVSKAPLSDNTVSRTMIPDGDRSGGDGGGEQH